MSLFSMMIRGGLLLVAMGLAACGPAVSPPRPGALPRDATFELPTAPPVQEPTASATRVLSENVLTPSPTPTITPIPDEVAGFVVEIIDGQTIAVVMNGDPPDMAYEVRYIGIEPPDNNAWNVVARETNRRLTRLKVVRLVRDETNFDDDGHLLRHVYIDDQLVSVLLAEQGLAIADPTEPNTRFADEIAAAQENAQEGNLGVWNPNEPTPTATRSPRTPTPEVVEVTTTPAAPASAETEEAEETTEAESEAATATPTEEATPEPTDEPEPTEEATTEAE